MNNLTPMDEIIHVLEAYKKGGLNDTGGRTCLDGYNQALRIVRTLTTVYFTSGQGDRLLSAFEEYADVNKASRIYAVSRCSVCGSVHGDMKMMPDIEVDGHKDTKKYWFLCPDLLIPAYYFPD